MSINQSGVLKYSKAQGVKARPEFLLLVSFSGVRAVGGGGGRGAAAPLVTEMFEIFREKC